MKKLTFTILAVCISLAVSAQYSSLNAHSHNDYEQKTPFRLAYDARFGSIEADIWAVDGELFVAHNRSQITPERTLESLYLRPIVTLFQANGGKVWKEGEASFQLLIDLKTEAEPTLQLLVAQLKKYPGVFDPRVNKQAVCVTVTGNRPSPGNFKNYPDFIHFDGNIDKKYNESELKRVALYSENLRTLTSWDGKADIPAKEKQRLRQVIDSVHGIHKKIRFWNAPDQPQAWKTLINLRVDYINTDHIRELADYLKAEKNSR